jgi:hypothetical protein
MTVTKGKLFEFAIIAHPTSEEAKDGKGTEILVKPEVIVAPDERTANIMASRRIPESHLTKLDRVDIALRPF